MENKEFPALNTAHLQSIENNDDLTFDTNNPDLGNEILKVYFKPDEKKGLEIKLIVRPNLEKVYPPAYIHYICNGIGRFMVDSIKYLEVKKTENAEVNKEPNERSF